MVSLSNHEVGYPVPRRRVLVLRGARHKVYSNIDAPRCIG